MQSPKRTRSKSSLQTIQLAWYGPGTCVCKSTNHMYCVDRRFVVYTQYKNRNTIPFSSPILPPAKLYYPSECMNNADTILDHCLALVVALWLVGGACSRSEMYIVVRFDPVHIQWVYISIQECILGFHARNYMHPVISIQYVRILARVRHSRIPQLIRDWKLQKSNVPKASFSPSTTYNNLL